MEIDTFLWMNTICLHPKKIKKSSQVFLLRKRKENCPSKIYFFYFSFRKKKFWKNKNKYQHFWIYLYNILGFVLLWLVVVLSIHPSRHPSRHPSVPPSIQGKEGGRARALLKLQNSTVSGNCPFCPIYSRIGIQPVMKGYWPIIKISVRHWGRLSMQLVRPIFFFFGFWGEGKGRIFFIFLLGVGVPSSIHGTEETIMW